MSNLTDTAACTRRQQWQQDGFVIIPQLFSAAELLRLSAEIWDLTRRDDLIDRLNLRCRFQATIEGHDTVWEAFDPVIDLSPRCRRLAQDERLMSILESLYGEPACLFKDKLIFKQPKTRGYPLHQDWIAWPGFPRSFLTVLVAIDPATVENGCTEVFPGYHARGPMTPEDGQFRPLPNEAVDASRGVPLELEPGDVAVFHGLTPHRSAPNRSSTWRRQLYLSYNAASDGGDQRAKHYAEFHSYLKQRSSDERALGTYFFR